MPSSKVVEELNVIEYLRPHFVPRAEHPSLDPLCFQAGEEAFSDSITLEDGVSLERV